MACQIEPKLGGRHWGDMEIQNCYKHVVAISTIANTAAILKIQSCLTHFVTISTMANITAIMKILCLGLLTMVGPSSVCPIVTFHSFDITIRSPQLLSAPEEYVGWRGNLVEGIRQQGDLE